MSRKLLYIPFLVIFIFCFTDCAKKGTPTGGPRDTIAPIIVRSTPENFTTNFSENEFRIYFDEYIKLKDVQQNLIISPPLKYAPAITPLSASKVLKVKILDTLRENTTYSFNFGKSIIDNNEGNEFEYFKYIFSTGSYIDSLKLKGTIADAVKGKPDGTTAVMLYEVNESYTDSLIFSEKPLYITTTTDSSSTFNFENLKAGTYKLVALQDGNNDYIYQPRTDKIAFQVAQITIPTENEYSLSLFKEKRAYKLVTPKHVSKNEIQFGYIGDASKLALQLLSNVPSNYKSTLYKDVSRDTLHYWFTPEITTDSLLFKATNISEVDTLNVRIRDLYKDSLQLRALNPGVLLLRDSLMFSANIPLTSFTSEMIQVTTSDSIIVPSSAALKLKNNTISVLFPKQEEQRYRVQLFPGAVTDFFENTNDTLSVNVRTKLTSDYGTLTVQLQNVDAYPVIAELVDKDFKVVAKKVVATSQTPIYFDFIEPATYFIRVVIDSNNNGIWDTGNFLANVQPERIVYYPSPLEIKPNWDLNETFTLSGTNPDPSKTEDAPDE